ncbi:MAG: DNA replication/repair protein RecF [Pseudomonadota bacterium]
MTVEAARLSISSLTLSYFRSHGRSEIVTDGASVAIFGPNGAGKTNILEAISLLSPGRGLRRAKTEEIARQPDRIGWKVTGLVQAGTREIRVETSFTGDGPRKVNLDGEDANQLALAETLRMAWLVPSMDRLWIEGAEGRRRFLDRIALNFFPSHGALSLAYEKSMRERNRMLKDGVRDPAWYGAVEAQMARAGAEVERHRQTTLVYLEEAQAAVETAFPTADLTLSSSDNDVPVTDEGALRAAYEKGRAQDMAAGRSLVGPHRTDLLASYKSKSMPAKDCSTGEQKALLISLVLASGRAIAEQYGAPPILLLDEVAAHLDQSRRAALYQELASLGCQAWMTGTGAELFEDVAPSTLMLEVVEQDGDSAVIRH